MEARINHFMQSHKPRVSHVSFVIGALILLVGLTTSAIFVADETWMDESISHLGIDEDVDFIFNGTMILFGLSIIPLMSDLRKTIRSQYLSAEVLDQHPIFNYLIDALLIAPFCVMGIGLIPYTVSLHLHNACAGLAIVIFASNMGIFTLSLYPKRIGIRYVSSFLLAVILLATLIYAIEVINYVVYEFILIIAVVLWVYFMSIYFRVSQES